MSVFKWTYTSSQVKKIKRSRLVNNLQEIIDVGFSENENNARNVFEGCLEKIKADKGHEVYRWDLNKKTYFIKKYADKNWKRRLRNIFRQAEARRVVGVMKNLDEIGVDALPVIFAGEFSENIFLKKSLTVSASVSGTDLEFFFNNVEDFERRGKVIDLLAENYARMLDNKFVNGDPSLSNFFLTDNSESRDLVLIDLDNVKKYPVLPAYFMKKNLSKLIAIIYARETKMEYEEKLKLLKKILNRLYDDPYCLIEDIMAQVCSRLKKWELHHLIDKNSNLHSFKE